MSKKEAIKIESVTIKLGEISADLSIEEARQLKEALDEIFPSQVEPVQIHWSHQPYYITTEDYPKWTFTGTSAQLSVEHEGKMIT